MNTSGSALEGGWDHLSLPLTSLLLETKTLWEIRRLRFGGGPHGLRPRGSQGEERRGLEPNRPSAFRRASKNWRKKREKRQRKAKKRLPLRSFSNPVTQTHYPKRANKKETFMKKGGTELLRSPCLPCCRILAGGHAGKFRSLRAVPVRRLLSKFLAG